MVERDDFAQGRPELLARARVLLVQQGGIDTPAHRDRSNRQIFVESEVEEFDAFLCPNPDLRRAVLLGGPLALEIRGFTKDRFRPGLIEEARQSRFLPRQVVGIGHAGVLRFPSTATRAFDSERDVARDAEEKSTKSSGAVLLDAVERASFTEALEEDLLHGVIDIEAECRITPTRAEVRAHNRLIAAAEIVPAFFPPRSSSFDQHPASRVRQCHEEFPQSAAR